MNSSKEKPDKLEMFQATKYSPMPLSNTLIEDWTYELKLFGIPEKFHEKILSEKKKDVMDSFIANFQTWDEINSKQKIPIPFKPDDFEKMTKDELKFIGTSLFKQRYKSKETKDDILRELKGFANMYFFQYDPSMTCQLMKQ
jgi:hypothetical protein